MASAATTVCAMCGSAEHLRFACPVRTAHLAQSCALVRCRQRLLWARWAAPAGAGSSSVELLPRSVFERVAAELAGSSSQKVASKSLPDDPFFKLRPHQPGKRKHRQPGGAHCPGGKQRQTQRTEQQKRAAARKQADDRDNAEATDERILLRDYTTPMPEAMLSMLADTWGAESERLKAYCRCLTVPPGYTCVRVNTLQCPDVESAKQQLEDILAPLRASRFETGSSGADGGGDGVDVPRWPIRRHEMLPDVLIIPSTPPPAPATAIPTDTSGSSSATATAAVPPLAVVVDRLCGEAVLRGADVFAGGVRCASSGILVGSEVEVWCDLDNLVKHGSDISHYIGRRVLVSRGVSKMGRVQMFRDKCGLAVETKDRACGDAPPMNGVLPDILAQQNLPSAVVAHVLCGDTAEGESVIDLCAAPGGKTAHIAGLMRNKGLLVAVDRSRRKMVQLAERMHMLGASCVVPLAIDSTKLLSDCSTPKEHRLPRQIVRSCHDPFSGSCDAQLMLQLAAIVHRWKAQHRGRMSHACLTSMGFLAGLSIEYCWMGRVQHLVCFAI